MPHHCYEITFLSPFLTDAYFAEHPLFNKSDRYSEILPNVKMQVSEFNVRYWTGLLSLSVILGLAWQYIACLRVIKIYWWFYKTASAVRYWLDLITYHFLREPLISYKHLKLLLWNTYSKWYNLFVVFEKYSCSFYCVTFM